MTGLRRVETHGTDEPIGLDRQHGAKQLSHHALRSVPEEQAGDTAASDGPHDHEIDASSRHVLRDDVLGLAPAMDGLRLR